MSKWFGLGGGSDRSGFDAGKLKESSKRADGNIGKPRIDEKKGCWSRSTAGEGDRDGGFDAWINVVCGGGGPKNEKIKSGNIDNAYVDASFFFLSREDNGVSGDKDTPLFFASIMADVGDNEDDGYSDVRALFLGKGRW